MRLVSLKPDGSSHRQWLSARTTVDAWAFFVPPQTLVREADGAEWSSAYPVVSLFWPQTLPQAGAQVMLLLKPTGTEYYCNVITPPHYDAADAVIRFHDLDLDVYVDGAGTRLLDEDEFTARQASYPQRWAQDARLAADWLLAMGTKRAGPFSAGLARWWESWCAYSET